MSKFILPLILALIQPLLGETATTRASAGGANADVTVEVKVDSDRDGLTDAQEDLNGNGIADTGETDLRKSDTDGDGLTDKDEVDAGTNPLINQFAIDPDWAAIPTATAGRIRAFWDFETYANGFSSRKNSHFATPHALTNPAPALPAWDENEGVLGKSANVGQRRYLEVPPNNLWTTYRSWTLAFSLKFAAVPSSAQTLPILSTFVGFTGQIDNDPGLQVSLVYGVPPGTSGGNKLYFKLHGLGGTYAEWLVPDGVSLTEWTDLIFACDGQYANGNTRKCYVNGTSVALNGGPYHPGYQPLNNPAYTNVGYILLGATKTSGTVTVCPTSISVDRWTLSDFNLGDLTILAQRDVDGDGATDREELANGTNPLVRELDVDRDGLTNAQERAGQATFNGVLKVFGATDPQNFDSDGDLFDDYWEAKYFQSGSVDPNNASLPSTNSDREGDGLTNWEEYLNGTDPNIADTDGDLITDKAEVDYGSNPLDILNKPLNSAAFYGDETLSSFFPIGDLGAVLKANDEKAPVVEARVGDESESESERWRLRVGDKRVVSETFGELSPWMRLALDPTRFHEIRLEHVATKSGKETDYDYTANVVPNPQSPFILSDPDGLLGGHIVEGVTTATSWSYQTAYLVPLDGYSWAASYSGGDAVGPRYRKVALNGRPIPDEKPQQEEESDLPGEETYVDAFNLGLRHDTTYHFTPLGSSDLVLQASASAEETGFTSRSGLRPHERFDLPFGVGWSSNLCSYVEVVETIGDESDDPVAVNVVDESGHPQRFGTRNFQSFFPWPSTRVEKKTYLNQLTRNGNAFTLQKKFGNTLTYNKCKTWFIYSTDRVEGSTKLRRHTYWRLAEARDRYGVRLQYDYDSSPGVPNDVALIPRKISSPDREGQSLVIERSADSRRIESITDSRGNQTTFHYTPNNSEYSLPGGVVAAAWKLTSVSFADGTSTGYSYESAVEDEADTTDLETTRHTSYYHTNLKSVTDKRANTHTFHYVFDKSKEYWDSSVNGTRCTVDLDSLPLNVRNDVAAQLAARNAEGHGVWKTMYGLPRKISSVSLPGGLGSAIFASTGHTKFGESVTFTPPRTTVTDAVGNATVYAFDDMRAEIVDVDATAKSVSKEWMVYYLTSSIHHGGAPGAAGHLGTETYQFDPTAGLALCGATDFSGNVTTWEFSNAYAAMPTGLPQTSTTMTKWADPTAKIDALQRREEYTYSDSFRVMDTSNDPHGTTTTFAVDGLGRRKSKSVLQYGTTPLLQERYDYGNQRFKAFLTGKATLAFASVSVQPWETDLKTTLLPDALGRVWREIVDPDGAKLATEYTYDSNNNRTSTLDARGNRIRFAYDKLNRLFETTYPPAGTRSGEAITTQKIWYNQNGDKAAEFDEEGHCTIYHYDSLNRRVAVIRDMDGLGLPTRNTNDLVTDDTKGAATGGDLVTRIAYNKVGSITHQIDPRGSVTRTFHDSIQRPSHVFTGLTETEANGDLAACTAAAAASHDKTHTEFQYTDAGLTLPEGGGVKGNPGGSAFDSSGFKPTLAIRHAAVLTATGTADLHTFAQYDALYRPLRTETEYESGAFAVSTITYGEIANDKEALQTTTTDDREKVTLTVMDGLQRPISVTDGYGGTIPATSYTIYSSTGLVWKSIAPLSRQTETEYDGAARPVKVWQPDPVTGVVNRSAPNDPLQGSPCTQTAYDKNGNVTVTLNPLGYRWEYEYDARNRRTVESLPSVTQTEIVDDVPVEQPFMHPVIRTAFDGVGNVVSVTNARGHVTRSFRDNAYRVTDVRTNPVTGTPSDNPQNPGTGDITIHSALDTNGNALSVTDGNGNTTQNTYDRLNRLLTTATNPVTGQPSADPGSPAAGDIAVTNAYDDAGNLVQVKDGEGHLTGFRHDGLGRKTLTIWDEGSAVWRAEKATYDGAVLLTRLDPKNQLTTYQYDALNRVEDIVFTNAAAENRHHTYDLAGNLLTVTYPDENETRKVLLGTKQVFDKLNRLKEETSAGAPHSYTYDKAGNRRTTTYAATGRYLASTYDKLNRLLTCTEKDTFNSTVENRTTYAYDMGGNVTRKTLPNNTSTRSTFDALNRKLTEATGTETGTLISRFDYSVATAGFPSGYDNAGNLLKVFEFYGHAEIKGRTVTNTYDHTHRLATETLAEVEGTTVVTAYGYDDANNRTTKIVTGGNNPGTWISTYGTTTDTYNSNQLKAVTFGATVTSFQYDPNGCRIIKQVDGVTTQSYGYDRENRLTSVADKTRGIYRYSYDHRTRRIVRDETNASGQNDEISFSGGLSVQEYPSGSEMPAVETIRGSDYGGGIGGVLYTIRAGSRSFNAYNSRGDVVSRTDSSAAITWQATYEAFGTRTQEKGATLDRQRANTKDEDLWGALNEGQRYRDLEFGVFLTRDPMGFVDGPNVYTYVRQNPWTYYDPHGLSIGGWLADTFLNADTFGAGAELVTGADFGTARGWAEGAFGVVTIATNVVDVATNAVPGVGQAKAVVKKQIIKTVGKEVLSGGGEVVLKEAVQHAEEVVKVTGQVVDKAAGSARATKRASAEAVDVASDAAKKPPHANKVDERPATLYEKYDKDGNFQKHGVTKNEDPTKRYTKKQIDGGEVRPVERGPRSEMLKKERERVETKPGPDNREPWAGKRTGE